MKRAFSIIGCVALLGGCVLQRDHDALAAKAAQNDKELRAELAQMHADLEATRQRLDNALRASADSSTDVTSSKQKINDLAGRFDEVHHNIDELKRDVVATRSELYARMDDLRRGQQPPSAAPAPIAVPQDKTVHFSHIKEAYAKRDFATVRALGPEYVNRYPNDERSDETLFMLGDSDLQDGRPSSALAHFNRLLKLFPRSPLLDKTLYDMGEAYLMMHDCTNAKVAFDACEKRFGKAKIGMDAKAKLQTIQKNPPGLCAPS